MRVHFEPPQVQAAQSAKEFVKLVQEVAPHRGGELRVMQSYQGKPTRLVLITPRLPAATVEVTHGWLHQQLSQVEMREQLSALLRTVPEATQ